MKNSQTRRFNLETTEDLKKALLEVGITLYKGENKMAEDMKAREIGAMWAKQGKNGTFYTGQLNGKRVVMFATGNSEPKPQFKVFLEKEREI